MFVSSALADAPQIGRLDGQPEAMVAANQVGTFDVRQFGATGDGKTFDGPAVQRAIDACAAAGGGRVILPPGIYVTGTIRLLNNVRLVLEKDAVLLGSKDLNDYRPPGSGYRRKAFVLIDDATNVSIEGQGTVNGNSLRDPNGEEKIRGPHAIIMDRARHCSISGITIRDAGNYAMRAQNSEQISVDSVTVTGGWDGFHARKSKFLQVINCKFYTGDDSIAGADLEDVVVRDCVLNSACNAVRIIGPAKRLSVTDCQITGPGLHPHVTSGRNNTLAAVIFQPGSWGSQPGPSDQITFARLKIKDVQTVLHIGQRPGCTLGKFLMEDITATGIYGPASSVEGWEDSPIEQVTLRRIAIEHTLPQKSVPADNRDAVEQYIQMSVLEVKPLIFCVRALPAWAFYAANVKQLIMEDVNFHRPASAECSAMLYRNVANAVSTRVSVTPMD